MSTPTGIRNYKTLFQYPTLDKIHRQPTLDTILHLLCQCKANVQSIPTTLGGGQLGYLGLVISNEAYNSIPNTVSFIRPQHPGPFIVIPPEPTRQTRLTSTTNTPTPTTVTVATVTQ